MPVFDGRKHPQPFQVGNRLVLTQSTPNPMVWTGSQSAWFPFPLSRCAPALQPLDRGGSARAFRLHPTVVISYPDARLAGLRAVHAFSPYATAQGVEHTAETPATTSPTRRSFLPQCLTPSVRAVFGCGNANVELDSAVYTWTGPEWHDDTLDTTANRSSRAVPPTFDPFVRVVAADDSKAAASSAFQFPSVNAFTAPSSATGSSTCLTQAAQEDSAAMKASSVDSSALARPIQVHVLNVTADWADTEKVSLVQITGMPDAASIPWFTDALVSWLVGAAGPATTSPLDPAALTLPNQPHQAPSHLPSTRVRRVLVVAAADFKPNRGCANRVHQIGSPFDEPLPMQTSKAIFGAPTDAATDASAVPPRLDSSTTIADLFLNSLCAMLAVQEVCFTGLLYPAKKIPKYITPTVPAQAKDKGAPDTEVAYPDDAAEEEGNGAADTHLNSRYGEPLTVTPDDQQIVAALCSELDSITGLPFDWQRGCQIRLRYLVSGSRPSEREQQVKESMMYL
ncbi:hypothetical protein H4R35_002543 [Dimargaris xerosporica]|nr:hypothetical protein H4R35_002543 [Dimargaris xerosporica]